jgi:hypothetical protein
MELCPAQTNSIRPLIHYEVPAASITVLTQTKGSRCLLHLVSPVYTEVHIIHCILQYTLQYTVYRVYAVYCNIQCILYTEEYSVCCILKNTVYAVY